MKAKKKLLIGTLAAALVASGAGAVSTMAWYQATAAGSLSSVAGTTRTITASNGSHKFSGGALTFTGAFEALNEAVDPSADYNAVSNPYRETFDTDHFQNVELTNNNGYTYVTTPAGDNVVPSTTLGNTYGVAQVRFTLRNSSSVKPSEDDVKNAYSGGTTNVSLYIRGTGHAKVLSGATAPQKASTDVAEPASHGGEFTTLAIQVKCTITSAGAYSVEAKIGGGEFAAVTEVVNGSSVAQAEWLVKFYYAISPEYAGALDATGQSADTTDGHHSADSILISTSAS